MIEAFRSKQFVLFLLTGGTAAALNFASRIFYNRWVDFSTAVILAYLTGMVTAFILAKLFVFKQTHQSLGASALIFSLINVLAIAQTWAISMGLAYYVLPWMNVTRFPHEIAHAVGIAVPVFTSYIGHKYWSFR